MNRPCDEFWPCGECSDEMGLFDQESAEGVAVVADAPPLAPASVSASDAADAGQHLGAPLVTA